MNYLDIVSPVEMTSKHVRLVRGEWDHNLWRVTLHYDGRSFSTEYRMGLGIADAPRLDHVLECLLIDTAANRMSFREWCYEIGYDTDSRKALAMYHRCNATAKGLIVLFGSANFDRLVEAS